MAGARDDDRSTTCAFLAEAQEAAVRLGGDANHVWTAFGPTNVRIHQVATAIELGDIQVAVELGPKLDTSGLPIERPSAHDVVDQKTEGQTQSPARSSRPATAHRVTAVPVA